MKQLALAMTMALATTTTFAYQTASQILQSPGAYVLGKHEVEQLVDSARIRIADADGATRTWTHNGRGSVIATLERSRGGSARPLHGKGRANVDENGGYCVRIEWPRTEEAWCRRIVSLNGGYYAISNAPGDSGALEFDVVQPNRDRLSTLSRLWSLVRITAGAAAP